MAEGDLHVDEDGKAWVEIKCPHCDHVLSISAVQILGLAEKPEIVGEN